MSREQFFKPNKQEEPKAEETVAPEQLADWEIARARHLAAKEEFHKSRMPVHQTGEQKYLDKNF